jgi:mRNA interferase RelE/StbE
VTYRLSFKGSAQKEFMHLPPPIRALVGAKLDALGENPRPMGAEAPGGRLRGLTRVRVGDYRVIYHVDDGERHLIVTRVRHRSKAYRE